jgi:hypothetical protein
LQHDNARTWKREKCLVHFLTIFLLSAGDAMVPLIDCEQAAKVQSVRVVAIGTSAPQDKFLLKDRTPNSVWKKRDGAAL